VLLKHLLIAILVDKDLLLRYPIEINGHPLSFPRIAVESGDLVTHVLRRLCSPSGGDPTIELSIHIRSSKEKQQDSCVSEPMDHEPHKN
jgi:hypothetical protein